MKTAPLALLLAGGFLLGTSVAAASNLGQHGSVTTPQEQTLPAIAECGVDGEQDGQFEDAVVSECTDEPQADMNDLNDRNDESDESDENDENDESDENDENEGGDKVNNDAQNGDQAGDQKDDGENDDEGD